MKRPAIDLSGVRGIVTKILIVVAVIISVSVVMLKLVERSKDPLRQGIEQYLSEASGMMAGVDELQQVTFLPDVTFRMKNIVFRERGAESNIRAQIEGLDFAMPFSALLFGQTKIRALHITGVTAEAGVWTPHPLKLKSAELMALESERPALKAEGTYDGRPLKLYLEMAVRGADAASRVFILPEQSPFSLTLGRAVLTGTYGRGNDTPVLKGALLSGDGKAFGPRDISLKMDGNPAGDILSCLLAQRAAARIRDDYPCAAFLKE